MNDFEKRKRQLDALEQENDGWGRRTADKVGQVMSMGQVNLVPPRTQRQSRKEAEAAEKRSREMRAAESQRIREREAAEAKQVASVVDRDSEVKKLDKQLKAEQATLAELQTSLEETQAKMTQGQEETGGLLSSVKLVDLFKKAQEKTLSTTELAALAEVETELQRRIGQQESVVNELESQLEVTKRTVLHHHIDSLIAETHPLLESVGALLTDIRLYEEWIGDHGGIRQAFLTYRTKENIRDVLERWDVEMDEIRVGSEEY